MECDDKKIFISELQLQASSSEPCWIYGFPRTGSSWLCKRFFGKFTDSNFLEPFDYFQCSSVGASRDRINIKSSFENDRPEITKRLDLLEAPHDRLLLAMHEKFIFKFLFDFNIVQKLLELFPQSRFIWLVRDGRDVVESTTNPSTTNWPIPDLSYLGEEEEQRFTNSLLRWLKFSLMQIKIYHVYNEHILWLHYEDFSKDFFGTAVRVLDFSRLSYTEEAIRELEGNFKARTGLWEGWSDWKKSIFIESGAEKLNKKMGYEA